MTWTSRPSVVLCPAALLCFLPLMARNHARPSETKTDGLFKIVVSLHKVIQNSFYLWLQFSNKQHTKIGPPLKLKFPLFFRSFRKSSYASTVQFSCICVTAPKYLQVQGVLAFRDFTIRDPREFVILFQAATQRCFSRLQISVLQSFYGSYYSINFK